MATDRPRHATCQCGQLAIACVGEPLLVSICHCLDCQRRTGSAFGITAVYPRTSVAVARGTATQFRRMGGSGAPIAFHFCPECGSTLWWEPGREPGLTGVAAGAFADPGFPAPTRAIWDDRRHPWLSQPDGIVCHRQGAGG